MTSRPPITRVAVVVPARNEDRLLGACLDHLRAAMDVLERSSPSCAAGVTVVLDGCTDGSAAIAADAAARDARIGVLAVDHGCVGAARAAGAAAALGGADDPGTVWIACTDADTRVPAHWLRTMVALADAGADAVLGTVEPDADDVGAPRHASWRARHVLADGHGHVHGANLGVRANAYLAVGGFAPLPVHEDVRLVEGLRAGGARVVSSGRLHAVTSGRLDGRAPGGFSDYLLNL